jgi:hypothetical protein
LKLLSPQNQTYTGNVTLSFVKNGAVTWTVYILDNQTETMVFENTTLPRLSEGSHNLTIMYGDVVGDGIKSEMVQFTVTDHLPEAPWPTMPIAAASATSVATVGMGLAIYFKKRKHLTNPGTLH